MFTDFLNEEVLQLLLFFRAIMWAFFFSIVGWIAWRSPYGHLTSVRVLCAVCAIIVVVNIIAAAEWWQMFWG